MPPFTYTISTCQWNTPPPCSVGLSWNVKTFGLIGKVSTMKLVLILNENTSRSSYVKVKVNASCVIMDTVDWTLLLRAPVGVPMLSDCLGQTFTRWWHCWATRGPAGGKRCWHHRPPRGARVCLLRPGPLLLLRLSSLSVGHVATPAGDSAGQIMLKGFPPLESSPPHQYGLPSAPSSTPDQEWLAFEQI